MKFLAVIASMLIAIGVASCGGGSSESSPVESSTETTPTATTIAKSKGRRRGPRYMLPRKQIAALPKLKVAQLSGPPPKHIVTVDLREGKGPRVRKSDAVYVRFTQVSYPQGLKRSWTRGYGEPTRYGLEEVVQGWEVGLPGMKLGGRRELILPPKLTYPRWKPSWGYKPYVNVYVIDLVGLERRRAGTY